jgi:hypothetical protein
MLRPGEVDVARRTTSILGDMRGAHEFAEILTALARATPSRGIAGSEPTANPGGPGSLSFDSDSHPTLVNAIQHDDDQLGDLAGLLDRDRSEATIVLVRDGDPRPLYRRGIAFESVMTEAEWSTLGRAGYQHYLDERVAGITARYDTARIMAPAPGSTRRFGDKRRSVG